MRILSLSFLFVVALALQVDWPSCFKIFVPPATPPTHIAPAASQPAAFMLEQYNTACSEIRYRLEQESTLFTLKFSLVGAILALIFTAAVLPRPSGPESLNDDKGTGTPTDERKYFVLPLVALFCWAAVITGAIVDTRIMFHDDMIMTLGSWIRKYAEPVLYESSTDIKGWEAYLATESRLISGAFYPFLRLNASLLTFSVFAMNCMVFATQRFRSNQVCSRVSQVGGVGCFCIFPLIGIHFRYDSLPWIAICLVMALSGGIVSWVFFRRA